MQIAKLTARDLLKGISNEELRELCIAALRSWRQRYQGQRRVGMDGIADGLVPLLMQRRGGNVPYDGINLTEAFVGDNGLEGIAEFLTWFVTAGFAWGFPAQSGRGLGSLYLTDAGLRFVEGTKDHPLLPGFVDRLVKRCPGLPDDVVSLLADARACLDVGLMRPAIVLMGVAYEMAIQRIAERLVTKGHLKQADLDDNAAKLLAKVKAQVKTVLQDREQQFGADVACEFADQLRRRRNDGAHTAPTYGFEDREEAEEFLVSAGRHLPHLWHMH